MVDMGSDGKVSVSGWLDGELPPGPVPQPIDLCWPLDAEALEDLRDKRASPAPEVVARRVRLELEIGDGVTSAHRPLLEWIDGWLAK